MNNPYTDSFGTQRWYNSAGIYHREDGPAIISLTGYRVWYINGCPYYDNKEFQKAADITDEDMAIMILKYGDVGE
jgi:hypothetical protein